MLQFQLLQLVGEFGMLLQIALKFVFVFVYVHVEGRSRHMLTRPFNVYLIISRLQIQFVSNHLSTFKQKLILKFTSTGSYLQRIVRSFWVSRCISTLKAPLINKLNELKFIVNYRKKVSKPLGPLILTVNWPAPAPFVSQINLDLNLFNTPSHIPGPMTLTLLASGAPDTLIT